MASGVEVSEEWDLSPREGFVVIDLETTGLSPRSDRVLEVALIQTDYLGRPTAHWSTLINPQGPVGATEIHGITDSDVADFPSFEGIADEVIERIKGQALSAHNARFDIGFLSMELARVGWSLPDIPTVCTLTASRFFLPDLPQRRLADCAAAVGIATTNSHRALNDAAVTVGLLNYFLRREQTEGSPLGLLGYAATAQYVQWPTAKARQVIQTSDRRKAAPIMSPLDETLLTALSSISADDLVGSGNSDAELEYAELIIEFLEDGKLTEDETASLRDLAESFGLSDPQTMALHEKLLIFLAAEAWRDGVITQSERRHINSFASLLGFSESMGKQVLDHVEKARNERLSMRLKALPENWTLGEPLKIGDRVVFTGCDDFDRSGLERRATKRGVKVISAVSRKTSLLVSDGTVRGNKAKSAQELGIRIIHPTQFSEMLAYIQPQAPTREQPDHTPAVEDLICRTCGKDFQRISVKGRKPIECPECRL